MGERGKAVSSVADVVLASSSDATMQLVLVLDVVEIGLVGEMLAASLQSHLPSL